MADQVERKLFSIQKNCKVNCLRSSRRKQQEYTTHTPEKNNSKSYQEKHKSYQTQNKQQTMGKVCHNIDPHIGDSRFRESWKVFKNLRENERKTKNIVIINLKT